VGELAERIRAFQDENLHKFPSEILSTFADETAKQVASGIAEAALREGQAAPDFTLPDARGGSVTLSEVLGHGPAVVTFYRGVW